MTKIFIYGLLISICNVFVLGNTVAAPDSNVNERTVQSKYFPASVNMDIVKVSEHVYYVQGMAGMATEHEGFISNASIVVTEEGVVLFDALGTPSLASLLLDKIRTVTNKPIVKVVASHYHADHIYGLPLFKELGAEIVAPVGAENYLASDGAKTRLEERRQSLRPWVDENTYLVKPDVVVKRDKQFELGGVKFLISNMGSVHSDGDLIMRVEPDQVLLAGDLIFEGRIPFIAGQTPDQWAKVLDKLDTSKLVAIIPGHGPVSSRPNEAVRFTKGYMEFLYEKMANAVAELTPFEEAYQNIDWGKYKNMPASQANRINAYRVFLALEAKSFKQ